MPCMEPLWVKVSEKSTVLRAKAFNQLTLEILENSTESAFWMFECVYHASWYSREDGETFPVFCLSFAYLRHRTRLPRLIR